MDTSETFIVFHPVAQAAVADASKAFADPALSEYIATFIFPDDANFALILFKVS